MRTSVLQGEDSVGRRWKGWSGDSRAKASGRTGVVSRQRDDKDPQGSGPGKEDEE